MIGIFKKRVRDFNIKEMLVFENISIRLEHDEV